jgi:hypothetical protein
MKDTTRRVYRYLYRAGKPIGIHEVQRGLELSSTSVAAYHIKKLLEDELIKEQDGGYVVDRVVLDNMIRIRRAVIPFETTYTIFFASTLFILLLVYFPNPVTSGYIFAVFINVAALGFFIYETLKAFQQQI